MIIRELIEQYSDGKNADFAKLLGVKPQTISSWMARNTFDIELVFAKCENIDANWLLTGEGNMYRSKDGEGASPPVDANKEEVIRLLREKVRDQQEIIDLLKEKVRALQGAS